MYEDESKAKMLEAVKELPPDATIEDAMERFLFLAKIDAFAKSRSECINYC